MMSPLRQRMTEDMQLRNLSAATQRVYVHYIFGLAKFYLISPDLLSLEEVREYQLTARFTRCSRRSRSVPLVGFPAPRNRATLFQSQQPQKINLSLSFQDF